MGRLSQNTVYAIVTIVITQWLSGAGMLSKNTVHTIVRSRTQLQFAIGFTAADINLFLSVE